jgi:hypothetical protein
MALDVAARQTITFWFNADETTWEQQRSAWFAAKFKIHATESSLWM